MEHHAVESVREIIDYIETHLDEKLNLDMAAFAIHYSEYHLHHMFTDMVGMTLHDYIRRRQKRDFLSFPRVTFESIASCREQIYNNFITGKSRRMGYAVSGVCGLLYK